MSLFAIITLVALGICLVLLEILVLPGFIIGVIGGCMMLAGVGGSYYYYGFFTGNIILIGTVILSAVAGVLAFNSRTWKRISLHAEIDGKVNNPDVSNVAPGDTGVALTRLGPMGNVRINDIVLEGKAEDGIISSGAAIEVVSVNTSSVTVKLISDNNS